VFDPNTGFPGVSLSSIASRLHTVPEMKRTLLIAALAALLGGCGPTGGTDVGNGRSISFRLEGHDAATPAGAKSLTLASGVTLDEAWIAIDRIRLEQLSSCDVDDDEIDVEGPIVADLVNKQQLGSSSFISFDHQFCRLRVRFRDLDLEDAPAGTPAALDGSSILVTGSRADGVPFLVRSDLADELELRALAGGFTLASDFATLLVAYELGSWIVALDLDSLGGPSIVIDEAQNTDRLEAFEAAVKISAELYDDRDEDGALGPSDELIAN
jgi:hypothetical protein